MIQILILLLNMKKIRNIAKNQFSLILTVRINYFVNASCINNTVYSFNSFYYTAFSFSHFCGKFLNFIIGVSFSNYFGSFTFPLCSPFVITNDICILFCGITVTVETNNLSLNSLCAHHQLSILTIP